MDKSIKMAVVDYLPEEAEKFEKLKVVERIWDYIVMRGVTEMTKVN